MAAVALIGLIAAKFYLERQRRYGDWQSLTNLRPVAKDGRGVCDGGTAGFAYVGRSAAELPHVTYASEDQVTLTLSQLAMSNAIAGQLPVANSFIQDPPDGSPRMGVTLSIPSVRRR